MSELQDIAIGKLSTRETLIREIQKQVRSDLRGESESPWRDRLNGPLGEQIAIAAGSWDLALAAPVDIAEGICNWLDTYFLQSPQNHGPREGTEDASPPPSNGSVDGSRVGALIHLPHLIAQEFGISASEARRLICQGGASINGERLSVDDVDVAPSRLDGAQVRIGKRRAITFRLTKDAVN